MNILAQEKIDIFRKYLGHRTRNGLDIGCGSGWLSKTFETIGIDLNLLQEKGKGDDIQNLIGDAHFLPFKSQTFDFVILSEVLEHVKNPLMVLREANFVLKRKGIALISVPNGRGLYMLFATKLPEILLKRKIHNAINFINLDWLAESIKAVNFMVNEIDPTFLVFAFIGFCVRIFDKIIGTRLASFVFEPRRSLLISVLKKLDKLLLKRTSLCNADGWYIKASKI